MSVDALSYIRKGNKAVVHSVFKNTINILIKGHIVSIQTPTLPLTPLSLKIQEKDIIFSKLEINPGDFVVFDQNKIVINQYTFNIEPIKLWSGKLNPTYIKINDDLIKLLIKVLRTHGKSGGIGYKELAVDQRFNKIISDDLAVKEFKDSSWIDLNQIPPYRKKQDIFVYINAITSFIGAGPGLTPSGDDFILGFLSVLYRVKGQNILLDNFLKILKDTIISGSCKTTDVSKEYFYYGGQGIFSETVHALYKEIEYGNKERICRAAVDMIKIGATSGSDSLTGIIYGMRFCEEILQTEMRS